MLLPKTKPLNFRVEILITFLKSCLSPAALRESLPLRTAQVVTPAPSIAALLSYRVPGSALHGLGLRRSGKRVCVS